MEMANDDRPPEAIWLDGEALQEHFQRVQDRYRSGGGTETVPDPELDTNEMTERLMRG